MSLSKAANANTLEQSRRIAEGFRALTQDYSELAARHWNVETQLESIVNQIDALKNLSLNQFLPNVPKPTSAARDGNYQPKPDTFNQWLDHLQGRFARDRHAIDKIRSADEACSALLQPEEPQLSANHCPAHSDNEQDPTSHTRQRKRGCPFASVTSGMGKCHLPTPASSHGMPSLVKSPSNASKIPSFHDPMDRGVNEAMETDMHENSVRQAGFSAVDSIASGPACPIRFLDKHEPEEIAEYFEQHKHELPRSHELCVGRFQDNTDSIRELDAKYGNLVSMIQGLGLKHRPMLPDDRKDGRIDELDELIAQNERSNGMIKAWAHNVSQSIVAAAGSSKCGAGSKKGETIGDRNVLGQDGILLCDNGIASESPDDGERSQRFDRPLRDIRVGESPSRPWGVPLPSKDHDWSDSNAASATSEPKPASPRFAHSHRPFDSDANIDLIEDVGQSPNKCLSGRSVCDARARAAASPSPCNKARPFTKTDSHLRRIRETNHRPTDDRAGSQKEHSKQGVTSRGSLPTGGNHLINRGTVFVAKANDIWEESCSSLNGLVLENYGTLLVGYSPEGTRTLDNMQDCPSRPR